MKKTITFFRRAVMTLMLLLATSVQAWAQTSVSYNAYNTGTRAFETLTANSCTEVTSSTTTMGASGNVTWYVVNSNVTINSSRIEVLGTVNLILADGYSLRAEKGFHVSNGVTLNIYDQSGGTGQLHSFAIENGQAGIGGNYGEAGGTLTIHGGSVEAIGGQWGAGIGGGREGNGGSINIYGGSINATGGATGAGIGGGVGANCGTITIVGGTVIATATTSYEGDNSQAIGSGDNCNSGDGTLIIDNIKVYSSAGAANPVAPANRLSTCHSKYAKLMLCSPHNYVNDVCTYCGGTPDAANPGTYLVYQPATHTFAEQTAINPIIVNSATTTLGADNTETWYTVSNNVTVSNRITVYGTVHLILCDGKTLTASSGITVNTGNTLNIYGQASGTGTLNATAAGGNHAGIGTLNDQYNALGTINIHGGIVTAEGADWSAGIGGGVQSGGGSIAIYGGTVNATGHDGIAEGIGCGSSGPAVTKSLADGLRVTVNNSSSPVSSGDRVSSLSQKVVRVEPCTTHSYSNNRCIYCATPHYGHITYNGNGATGGTVPTDNTNYANHTDVTVMGNTGNLALTGYAFAGWNTQADGSGTNYAPASTLSVYGDITLYAQWTPITYIVRFNNNSDAATGTMSDQTMTYDAAQALTANAFSLNNRVFAGWSTTPDGTLAYTDGQSVVNLAAEQSAVVNLYALWAQSTYTITYNLNGGSVATPNPTTYNEFSHTFTLVNPTRTGYTFTGWTGTGLSVPTMTVTIPTGSTGNRSYTANWEDRVDYLVYNTSTHTFDINSISSGRIAVTSETTSMSSGWYVVENNVTIGSRITVTGTVNLILREGTTMTASEGITVNTGNTLNIYTEASGSGTLVASVTSGANFAAIGTENSSSSQTNTLGTVNIHGGIITANGGPWSAGIGGGVNSGSGAVSIYGGTISANTGEPGYGEQEAVGRGSSGSTVTKSIADGLRVTVGSNTTPVEYGNRLSSLGNKSVRVEPCHEHHLSNGYCSYCGITCFGVTYNANNATSGSVPTDAIAYESGQTVTVLGNTGSLVRTGYTFAGWNTKANGTGTTYTADATFTINASTTLYAKWTPITYIVRFNKNDDAATGTMSDQTLTYDAAHALTANAFTYEGYELLGWRTTADGPVVYTDGQSVVNLAAEQGAVVDLYAFWAESYTITYDLDGGSVTTPNPTHYTIYSSDITLNNPERTGYTFLGWTGSNGDTPQTTVTIPAGSTGNKSYTANWQSGDFYLAYNTTLNDFEAILIPDNCTTVTGSTSATTLSSGWYVVSNNVTFSKRVTISGTVNLILREGKTMTASMGITVSSGNTLNIYSQLGGTGTLNSYVSGSNNVPNNAGIGSIGNSNDCGTVNIHGGIITATSGPWSAGIGGGVNQGGGTIRIYGGTVNATGQNNGSQAIGKGSSGHSVANVTRYLADGLRVFVGDNTTPVDYNNRVSSLDNLSVRIEPCTEHNSPNGRCTKCGRYQWYTVTYNGNGATSGSVPVDATHYVSSGSPSATVLGNPGNLERTGYNFAGWNTLANGTGTNYTEGSTFTINAPVTLYARWTPVTYTVRYHSNHPAATGAMADQTFTYSVGGGLNTNTFSRTGYNFEGWSTSSDGYAYYLDEEGVINLATTQDAVVDLYAVWSPIRYYVYFESNHPDATGNTDYMYFTYDKAKTLTANAFFRTGYSFAGWSTTSDGAVEYTDGQNVVNLTSTDYANIFLYAVWTPNTYVVRFNKNDEGASGTMADQTFTYDVAQNLTANTFTPPTGKALAGWSTASNGSVTYLDGANVFNLASEQDAVVDLYAVWSEPYTLSYDLAGGTVATANPTSYTAATPTFTLVNPTRIGYTFTGWTGTGLDAATTTVTIATSSTGNRSYTATWTIDTYTITYNGLEGATFATENPMTYTVETPTFTLTNPTREGHTFLGWTGTDLPSFGTEVTIAAGSTGNRQYTAHWDVYCLAYNETSHQFDLVSPEEFTVVTSSTTAMADGWYAVNSNTTVSSRIEVTGTVNLILCDGKTLTARKGLHVPEGVTLNIYGQSAGTGALTISNVNSYQAGIGSDYTNSTVENAGSVTIHGGNVTATGGSDAAGIGGGDNGSGGTFTIYGGTVTANAGSWAAGIGGGENGAGCSAVVIAGGTVNATGKNAGAGIGGGPNGSGGGTVTITGGVVNATGSSQSSNSAAGIGGGHNRAGCSTVTITGGTVTAIAGNSSAEAIGRGQGNQSSGTLTPFDEMKVFASANAMEPVATGSRESTCRSAYAKLMPCTEHNWEGNSCIWCGATCTGVAYGRNHATGGTAPVDNNNYTNGQQVTVLDNTGNLERTGYTYAGWNTSADGSGTNYSAGSTFVFSGNTTLYAKWTPVTYTISYNLDGGTLATPNPTSYTPNDEITLVNPTKEGYSFGGWTGTGLSSNTLTVTIPTGSTGDRSYTAIWLPTLEYSAYNTTTQEFEARSAEAYLDVTSTTMSNGWYAVRSDINISNRIEVTGTVNLILCDGATLTAPKGFHVPSGVTLNVYGQSAGTGALTISNVDNYQAGIGSDYPNSTAENAGSVIIHGGNVTATSGSYAAGIGGGRNGSGGTFTIYGGNVTANGGSFGAGIGGGYYGTGCNSVNIVGGTVNATGKYGSAGIGGGYRGGGGGTVTISGGMVNATGKDEGYYAAAGIGGGSYSAGCSTVTITGGTVTAIAGNNNNNAQAIGHGENSSASGTLTPLDEMKVFASADATEPVASGSRESTCRSAYAKLMPCTEHHWVNNTCTWCVAVNTGVAYVGNGATIGTVPLDATEYSVGQTVTVLGNGNLVRTGYDFAGWNTADDGTGTGYAAGATFTFSAPVVLYAQWTISTYTITFEDWDGTELQSSPVAYGETPAYTGTTPTRAADAQYTYTFSGWSPEITTVTSDATYTAQYTEMVNEYIITFKDWDGTELQSSQVSYGETPAYTGETPTREADAQYTYTFSGWSPAIAAVTGNATYTAQYSQSAIEYTITYNGLEDATLASPNPTTYTVESGDITLVNPTKTGYTFSGWMGTGLDVAATTVTISSGSTGNRSYTATWTPITYTVRFNKNSNTATGTMNDQSFTYDVAQNLIANTFSPSDNMDFVGWSTAADGLVTYTDGQNVINLAAEQGTIVNLYAIWAYIYTINYDLAGGTMATENPTSYSEYSSTFTLVNPTREGYTFAGWTGTGLTEATMTVVITSGSTGNRSYTATWTPITYSISYDLAGGSIATDNPETYNIETPTFTLTNPTKVGYTFAGWTGTGLDAASTMVTIDPGSTGDRSYTATWTPVTYAVRFNKNNEAATGTMADQTFTYDVAQNLSANEFSAATTGYGFAGWSTTDDGEIVYGDGQSVSNLSTTQNDVVNLYAQWTPIVFSINYHLSGGSLTTTNYSYTVNDATITLDVPTRTYYDFDGWYDNSSFTGNAVTVIASGSTGNVELWAKWTPIAYNITYDLAGGTTPAANPETYTIESEPITLINPERDGYYFVGWTGTGLATTTATVVIPTGSTGDRSYTANWIDYGSVVPYLAYDTTTGTFETQLAQVYTTVSSSTTAMADGWYVVNSNTSINNRIEVTGTVNLILCDGKTLTDNKGFHVPSGATLIIYGQNAGTGTLNATANDYSQAAIGGNNNEGGGKVTIHGGNITATGYYYGAGIGGGYYGIGGTINIYGGTVTALSQYCGAGIGGGYHGNGGTVSIIGGTVTATGGSQGGAGIGGGYYNYNGTGGTVTISGGNITATGGSSGGAGIGGGYYGNGATVTITGGIVNATGGGNDIYCGAGIGGGYNGSGGSVTVSGGTVIAVAGNYGIETSDNSSTQAIGRGRGSSSSGSLTLGDIKVFKNASATVPVASGNRVSTCRTSYTRIEACTEHHWVENTCSWCGATCTGVAYGRNHATGGTVPVDNTNYTDDQPVTVLGNTGNLERDGYLYAGWNGAADGTGIDYAENSTFTYSGNITLYAKWNPITYNIVYHLDGGDIATPNLTSYTPNDEFTLVNPTKEGWVFGGWTGTGLEYPTPTVTIAAGSFGNREYTATWLPILEYQAYNTNTQDFETLTANSYIRVTPATTTMSNGWYAVYSDVSIASRINVTGTVNLILCDGATLTAPKGVHVPTGVTLNIYGQSGNTGGVTVANVDTYTSCIGGNKSENCGTITIHGGTVTAAGRNDGNGGAGIGGGYSGNGGTIAIHGGTVSATGSGINGGAGIGGGMYGAGGTSLTITGGTVTANGGGTSNGGAAGIGGGLNEPGYNSVIITGGTVIATSISDAQAIGRGHILSGTPASGNLTLGDMKVYASAGATEPVAADNRENTCRTNYAKLMPCTEHSWLDNVCIWCGTINNGVAYSGNGATSGTVPTDATIYTSGMTVTVLGNIGNLERTGYTYAGWNTSSNGSGDNYVEDATFAYNGPVTLHAKWSPVTYYITYELAGGSVATDNPTSYTAVSPDITLVNPTREGYTFAGWTGTDLSEATMTVTIPTGSTGDRTYTATWLPILEYRAYSTTTNEFETLTADAYLDFTSGITAMSGGWYAVRSNVTINSRINVTGTVNLILCDGATLTVPKGLHVPAGVTLNIYGQSAGTGSITISGCAGDQSGIGGNINENGGSVAIHGGIVTATGGDRAAGIGGRRNGGDVAIFGGTVTANGGLYAAGIGGGHAGGAGCNSLLITGGTVNATGGNGSAGIGGGYTGSGGGTVMITGGVVNATGSNSNSFKAAGIGGGHNGAGCDFVVISGGTVTVQGGADAQAIGRGNGSAASGSLTLGDMKVYASANATEPVASESRENTCRSTYAKLVPCTEHHWENNACTLCGAINNGVAYSGNGATGGTVPIDATEYSVDQTVTVLGNTGNLERTNYTFDRWNTAADGSGTSYAAGATFAFSTPLILYAQWTVNTYTITFVNYDNTELQSSQVAYGATPEYTGTTPTRDADDQYTYTFSGWSPEITTVTGDATYTAQYTETVNEYTITFVNWDGTELQSGSVAYGETPVYTGATPTRDADDQYTYTFNGWSPEITTVSGAATYTAQYSTTVNTYTITFEDWDGTVLQSGQLAYGETPAYTGATPIRDADDQYTYTFNGWSPEITTVSGTATYTAQYSTTVNTYTITFINYDNTVLQSSQVAYGETPVYTGTTPTRDATAQNSYTFSGWSPEITTVTGDATYTAQYTVIPNSTTDVAVSLAAGWQAISTPMHDNGKSYESIANVDGLTDANYDLLRYNESSATWENQKPYGTPTTGGFDVMEIGRGYIYRSSGVRTLTFNGMSNNEATYSVALTANNSSDLRGFNLVGNPYPYRVMVNRAFYSLNADGTWTAHLYGDSIDVAQGILVHTTTGETLTFYAATHSTNPGSKGYLPPLPGSLNLSGQSDQSDLSHQSDQRPFAYQQGNSVVITLAGHLEVYDALGRRLFSLEILNSQFSILNSQFPTSGVYILRLGEKTQKIVIK